MRKFKQNKLVRDLIPCFLENNFGSKINKKTLTATEFDTELRKKLQEETEEVLNAQNKQSLIEEIADIYEVIDSLIDLHALSKEKIIAMQAEKRRKRGGFSQRIFVTTAEHPQGSPAEKYCLNNSDKYPEVE